MCLRGVIRLRGEIRLRLMCLRNVSSRLRSRTRPGRNVSSKCVFVCGRKSACTSAHTMKMRADQSEDQTGSPSFAPPAARDDWEQVGVVASGTCSFSRLARGTTQLHHKYKRSPNYITYVNPLHYLVFEESHRFRQGFLVVWAFGGWCAPSSFGCLDMYFMRVC